MEIGTVRQVDIEQEMQQAYLDYAMSVIVSRALPDVRDGLKPVQRRILYAMHDMGLGADKPYKKSARIVGEVLGKYHPHGDTAVYEAMVRMAQDFSMRYPLVDGQGNFGSIDGDGAAAMRYTEARLQVLASELLADIDKDTVEFVPNFDGTLKEPAILPSALPNLLVNGASGIAVGMATNIPPHNLGEVCDALTYMLDNWKKVDDMSTADLLQFIQGPDFPTGGVVYRYAGGEGGEERVDALESAYAVGKGRFTVQAKAHVEEMSRNRHRIVVTELPYQVNKSRLVERIAELARDGKIDGITDLRDESDRQGLRVVIELSRTVDPRDVLAQLYKLTPMQMTFGMTLLALVDGEPRLLSLKKMLHLFIEHRRDIVTRRSHFDLERAKLRAHVLEGLLIALDNLDEVIALIRRSRTADTARDNLRKRFKLTEIQAQAILDMQLRRLAALERQKIEEEYKEKKKLIAYLEDLLAHPHKIMGVIRNELKDLKSRYGDPRRTQIVQRERRDLTTRDLVAEEDVVVAASASQKLRVYPLSAAGSLDKQAEGELIVNTGSGNTRDDLLVCLENGEAYVLPMHRLPFGERAAWMPFDELAGAERPAPMVAVSCLAADEEGHWPGFLTLVTRRGKAKRAAADDLQALRGSGTVIGLDDGDAVVSAFRTSGEQALLLCTTDGQAIRFREDEIRPMGLPAGGVMAIKLGNGDDVVGAVPVVEGAQLAAVTQAGYGKRTPLADFPLQKRYGGGVVAYKTADRTGKVAGVAEVGGSGALLVQTSKGRALTVRVRSLPQMGRSSQGKTVVRLNKGEQVSGVLSLTAESAPTETVPEPPRRKRSAPTSKAAASKTTAHASTSRRQAASKGKTPAPKATKRRAASKSGAAVETTAKVPIDKTAPPRRGRATQAEKAPADSAPKPAASGRSARTKPKSTTAERPKRPAAKATPKDEKPTTSKRTSTRARAKAEKDSARKPASRAAKKPASKPADGAHGEPTGKGTRSGAKKPVEKPAGKTTKPPAKKPQPAASKGPIKKKPAGSSTRKKGVVRSVGSGNKKK